MDVSVGNVIGVPMLPLGAADLSSPWMPEAGVLEFESGAVMLKLDAGICGGALGALSAGVITMHPFEADPDRA